MPLKSSRRHTHTLVIAPLVTAALMAALWSSDLIREWENVTVDQRFRARAKTDPPPDPRIVLLGIGDYSLRQRGRWEEWSRDIHAEFTERITHRAPKVLAYDFFFSEKSILNPDGDVRFGDALALHPGSITGMEIVSGGGESKTTRPPAEFYLGEKTFPLTRVSGDKNHLMGGIDANFPVPRIAESAFTGVINDPASRIDKMRRTMPMVARLGDKIYPSFVLQILIQLEETTPEAVNVVLGEAITVPKKEGGVWEIPIDDRGFMAINYRNTERFQMLDYIQVSDQLALFTKSVPWPENLPPLENQIIIVGQAAEGLQDLGPSPYYPLDPLFRIQATALDNILKSDHLHYVPAVAAIGAWLILAWLTLFLLKRAPVTLEFVLPFLTVILYVLLAYYVFETRSVVLPLVLPVVGFILIHAIVIGDRLITELQEKRYIKSVFGSYVSPEVVNQIIESGETPKLGGERVDITTLFSDIQGFSAFSEQLSPEELVELMVEYLSAMTDIITDEGGTLDKYIGDAIDAMYGAPLPLPGHGYHAVHSAILMQRTQNALRERWKTEGRSALVQGMRTRIGLNTGPAVVGNMGSQRRFNYTMMGDNVNLGARCESGAKTYGVYTMVTGETRDAAMRFQDDITYRFLDCIIVKGRTMPVKVYEVIEHRDQVDQSVIDCLEIYASGMDLYVSGDWDSAKKAFEKSAPFERFQPGVGIATNPSLLMSERCGLMSIHPPGAEWDGVYHMTSK